MMNPLTLLDRYLLRRMVASLLKALAGFILLYVVIDLLTHRRVAVLKNDVPWNIVLTYYACLAPRIVTRVAPLALLVCALLNLGNMAQNNEVTAVLAGGIPLRRLIRMPVAVAFAFALAVFALQETLGVAGAERAAQLEKRHLARSLVVKWTDASWPNLEGGWTVHVEKFNRVANTGENVRAHAIRQDAVEHIRARRIYWDEGRLAWFLEDGYWAVFEPDLSKTKVPGRRITQIPAPFTDTPAQLFALEQSPETKTAAALAQQIRRAEDRGTPTTHLWVDYHAKFAQPAICFVMVWLAIPFAMRLRRSGIAISFGLSIAIAMAFLILHGVALGLGHVEHLPPLAAAWLANALFLALGLILLARTPT